MDEFLLDEEIDSAAMAEAMGFSGFGMQGASKKRKFNPHADAAVSGSLGRQKKAATTTTGANNAPLGERSRLPPPSANLPARPPVVTALSLGGGKGNADEIDLDDDEDGDNGPSLVTESAEATTTTTENGYVGHGLSEPQSIDTSQPSRDSLPEEVGKAQAKIDIILASAGNVSGLPARPAGNPEFQGSFQKYNERFQPGRGARGPAHHAGVAVGGAPWWEGYYDSKMNENPWDILEKQRGLKSRGKWIPRSVTRPATERTGEQEAPHFIEDSNETSNTIRDDSATLHQTMTATTTTVQATEAP